MRPLIPQNLPPSLHSAHQLLGARVTIIVTPEVKSPERSLGSLQVLQLLLTEQGPPVQMVYHTQRVQSSSQLMPHLLGILSKPYHRFTFSATLV
jgi:hypothetical protein